MTFALLLTVLLMALTEKGMISTVSAAAAYENQLFSGDILSIEITVDPDEWQNMLDNAMQETYIPCTVTIAGRTFEQVAIRPKGNTSLSSVANTESDRFSFKMNFGYYIDEQTCFGLDKLVINNLYADATYLKEYLSYDLMHFLEVDAPLFTFADVSVNGETWGLYLALEGYDESFMQRVYGASDGQLYNVKSMDHGGGERPDDGAGMPAPDFQNNGGGRPDAPGRGANSWNGYSQEDFQPPQNGQTAMTEEMTPPDSGPDTASGTQSVPDGPEESSMRGDSPENLPPETQRPFEPGQNPGRSDQGGGPGGFPGSTGGGSLQYTDDQSASYSSIFDNAVTNAQEEDYQRVITALRHLSEGTDLEEYWDVDQVLRYLAAHTFVVNLDSYVSNMQQNYYLYEKAGKVSILPWDYNLAFGGFQTQDASAAVNFPIDTPVSGVDMSERPLIAQLLAVEEYQERYHDYLRQIVDQYFGNGLFETRIASVCLAIDSYVQNDPTAFYSYEEYTEAVDMLYTFCMLRAESVAGQLNGTIPSTTAGQQEQPELLVDSSQIQLSVMGAMNMGGGRGGERQEFFPFGEETQDMPSAETIGQVIELLHTAETDTLDADLLEQMKELGLTDTQVTWIQSLASQQENQRPPDTENPWSTADRVPEPENAAGQTNTLSWGWLIACVICLAAAIAGAACYRRQF